MIGVGKVECPLMDTIWRSLFHEGEAGYVFWEHLLRLKPAYHGVLRQATVEKNWALAGGGWLPVLGGLDGFGDVFGEQSDNFFELVAQREGGQNNSGAELLTAGLIVQQEAKIDNGHGA